MKFERVEHARIHAANPRQPVSPEALAIVAGLLLGLAAVLLLAAVKFAPALAAAWELL